MPSRFISLRYHSQAAINACDFRALKGFERAHPELYVGAPAPSGRDFFTAAAAQMNAFNRVFESPYKAELNALIALERAAS